MPLSNMNYNRREASPRHFNNLASKKQRRKTEYSNEGSRRRGSNLSAPIAVFNFPMRPVGYSPIDGQAIPPDDRYPPTVCRHDKFNDDLKIVNDDIASIGDSVPPGMYRVGPTRRSMDMHNRQIDNSSALPLRPSMNVYAEDNPPMPSHPRKAVVPRGVLDGGFNGTSDMRRKTSTDVLIVQDLLQKIVNRDPSKAVEVVNDPSVQKLLYLLSVEETISPDDLSRLRHLESDIMFECNKLIPFLRSFFGSCHTLDSVQDQILRDDNEFNRVDKPRIIPSSVSNTDDMGYGGMASKPNMMHSRSTEMPILHSRVGQAGSQALLASQQSRVLPPTSINNLMNKGDLGSSDKLSTSIQAGLKELQRKRQASTQVVMPPPEYIPLKDSDESNQHLGILGKVPKDASPLSVISADMPPSSTSPVRRAKQFSLYSNMDVSDMTSGGLSIPLLFNPVNSNYVSQRLMDINARKQNRANIDIIAAPGIMRSANAGESLTTTSPKSVEQMQSTSVEDVKLKVPRSGHYETKPYGSMSNQKVGRKALELIKLVIESWPFKLIDSTVSWSSNKTIRTIGNINLYAPPLLPAEALFLSEITARLSKSLLNKKKAEDELESKVALSRFTDTGEEDIVEAMELLYTDKPYQCNICGLRYKSSSAKQSHLSYHYSKQVEEKDRKQQISKHKSEIVFEGIWKPLEEWVESCTGSLTSSFVLSYLPSHKERVLTQQSDTMPQLETQIQERETPISSGYEGKELRVDTTDNAVDAGLSCYLESSWPSAAFSLSNLRIQEFLLSEYGTPLHNQSPQMEENGFATLETFKSRLHRYESVLASAASRCGIMPHSKHKIEINENKVAKDRCGKVCGVTNLVPLEATCTAFCSLCSNEIETSWNWIINDWVVQDAVLILLEAPLPTEPCLNSELDQRPAIDSDVDILSDSHLLFPVTNGPVASQGEIHTSFEDGRCVLAGEAPCLRDDSSRGDVGDKAGNSNDKKSKITHHRRLMNSSLLEVVATHPYQMLMSSRNAADKGFHTRRRTECSSDNHVCSSKSLYSLCNRSANHFLKWAFINTLYFIHKNKSSKMSIDRCRVKDFDKSIEDVQRKVLSTNLRSSTSKKFHCTNTDNCQNHEKMYESTPIDHHRKPDRAENLRISESNVYPLRCLLSLDLNVYRQFVDAHFGCDCSHTKKHEKRFNAERRSHSDDDDDDELIHAGTNDSSYRLRPYLEDELQSIETLHDIPQSVVFPWMNDDTLDVIDDAEDDLILQQMLEYTDGLQSLQTEQFSESELLSISSDASLFGGVGKAKRDREEFRHFGSSHLQRVSGSCSLHPPTNEASSTFDAHKETDKRGAKKRRTILNSDIIEGDDITEYLTFRDLVGGRTSDWQSLPQNTHYVHKLCAAHVLNRPV